MTTQEEIDYFVAIRDGLRAHPDWLRTAMDAVTQGMHAALTDERNRAGQLDLALRSALVLALPGRLSAEMKELLNGVVARALPQENASEVERKFLKQKQGHSANG